MVVKLNYKLTAIFCAVFLIAAVTLVSIYMPDSALAQSTALDKDAVRLPVIMYHHILKDGARRGDYVISPAQFENDLKYIKEHGYQTITCSQLIDFFEGGAPLPEKPILITFDDGYETVHEYAFPLLKKYGMRAVINVIGVHTDTFSKEEEPHHLSYSHVSWEQLCEMLYSGVFEVGNHTYNMHGDRSSKRYGVGKKTGETPEEYYNLLIKDIGGLNNVINEELGIMPEVFAYPFGSIPKESMKALFELDFKLLFTCEEKVNYIKPKADLPTKIKRFNRAGRYETYEFFKKLEE